MNGFGTLSNPNINVFYRQHLPTQDGAYPSSAANLAFYTNNVLFVGINQVDGKVGDEATRVRTNYNWVKSNMDRYKPKGMRVIVIFAHANMGSDRKEHFGSPFMSLMKNQYPDILALYIHGSGHKYATYMNDEDIPNLISLQVDAGDEADPLHISIMQDVVSDEYSVNIDKRDGYYYSGCQTDNMDKTWSSSY